MSALKSKGLLAAGSVHRVAVIGPGLDFTDKNEGYDFYAPQSIRGSPAGRETFHREFRLNFFFMQCSEFDVRTSSTLCSELTTHLSDFQLQINLYLTKSYT